MGTVKGGNSKEEVNFALQKKMKMCQVLNMPSEIHVREELFIIIWA